MQVYSVIQKILDTQLKTVKGLPSFAPENVKQTLVATKPWSRSTLVPAETQIIGVGQTGWRKDQGLYQIDLFYPQNSGNEQAQAMADAVMNAFVRGKYYTLGSTRVLIERVYRNPASSLAQATFYQIPIMVAWNYYDRQ